MLVYLPPDVIKALKLLAVEREVSVSQLVEQAIARLWMHRDQEDPSAPVDGPPTRP
jgi:hypothetical protein